MKVRNIYLAALMAFAFAACTDSDDTIIDTLSGDGNKTPLIVSANINDGGTASRATNKAFEEGDKFVSYVRHVTWGGKYLDTDNQEVDTWTDGCTLTGVTSITADQAPRLVTFTWGDDQETAEEWNYSTTTDLTVSYTNTANGTTNALYWDDFSNSAAEGTDLRTEGHYLQSYYGYCFNGGDDSKGGIETGGNVTTVLDETTGIIGWTVPTDQTNTAAVRQADILWSAEQTPIRYEHKSSRDDDRSTLKLPYTHAMSEVTVIVKTGAGFDFEENPTPLQNTTITLNGWNKSATLCAPSQSITNAGLGTEDAGQIEMAKGEVETTGSGTSTQATCSFVAMTVPHTTLSVGNILAKITDADGNNYEIPVTTSIVNAWSAELDNETEGIENGIAQAKGRADGSPSIPRGQGYKTRPGVHYTLTVTLSKISVKVEASITTWRDVYAETSASTDFRNDVMYFNFEGITATNDDALTIFALNSNGIEGELTNSKFENAKVSTASYTDDATKKWTCTPTLYWPNGNDAHYFRALSVYDDATKRYSGISGTTIDEKTSVTQGNDIIWATTAIHSGTDQDQQPFDYPNEGMAIKPRTGQVPLNMYHAMSKISINLETSQKADAAVNLTGAKIEIKSIATSGTISLGTGDIEPSAAVTDAISAKDAPVVDYCVIPQSIPDNAIIRIILADGTTYKAYLKDCLASGTDDVITEWERGQHYKYTIYLEKEAITFRVTIKDWDEKTGNGNANLEWD